MSTFLQLTNNVINYFGANDAEFLDETRRAINDTISEINVEEPEAPHLQGEHSITLTKDTSLVIGGLPDDYDHILDIKLNVSGKDDVPLMFTSKKDWGIARLYEQGSQVPAYYTIWNNQLYVAPNPDDAYTGTMNYYAYDTELTNDSDTCLLTDRYPRWEHVIEKGAVAKMHAFLQSDESAINSSRLNYEHSMNRFRAWIRRNFDKSPSATRIKCWKEVARSRNPLLPYELRR